jgi:hypothetical protein
MVKVSRSPKRKSRSRSQKLTLAKLKKLAKQNGISHSGLKKSSLKVKLVRNKISLSGGLAKVKKSMRKSRKARKQCKAGKVRSRATGRCHKKSVRKSRKPKCPAGQARSRKSGHCHKKKRSVRKSRKACKAGMVRSQKTHHCHKKSSGAKKSIRKHRKGRKSHSRRAKKH